MKITPENCLEHLRSHSGIHGDIDAKAKAWSVVYNYCLQNGARQLGYGIVTAISYIDSLQKQITKEPKDNDPWISVKDRFPEPGVKVLVLLTYGLGSTSIELSYTTKRFPDAFDSFHNEIITHWQYLPEPPK